MKLNYKRTLIVSLAFMSICAFWQVYDGIIPLILRDTYGLNYTRRGLVMGIDNLLALFLLPVFGAISDKKGVRMPFIVLGTALASIAVMALAFVVDSAAVSGGSVILFFVTLLFLLLSMGLYRSPAVALMADVTPKPLRSQGNAVINLMGAVGGLYTLVMVKVAVKTLPDGTADYTGLFIATAAFMVVAIALLALTLPERKLVAEMKAINYGVSKEEDQGKTETVNGQEKLPKPVFKSLLLILTTIGLWFLGYNAITTFFTDYATATWSGGLSHASTCLMVATVAAVASYIPIGIISAKIGRKNMIRIGLVVAAAGFAAAAVFAKEFSFYLYIVFAAVGFAQAAVTVNTFPMVWEISRVGNVGKYTGFYYTVSMAVQAVTPALVGFCQDNFGGKDVLFIYGLIFVALAIIPISLAKHGDNKPVAPKNKLEAFDVDD